ARKAVACPDSVGVGVMVSDNACGTPAVPPPQRVAPAGESLRAAQTQNSLHGGRCGGRPERMPQHPLRDALLVEVLRDPAEPEREARAEQQAGVDVGSLG